MECTFVPMSDLYERAVIDLFNYYIEHSIAAYPETAVPYAAFAQFQAMTRGYPAHVILRDETFAGFCFLHAYNPLPTFRHTAEVTYFLAPEVTGQGIGGLALQRLETDARAQGIIRLLASISAENAPSLAFHRKHGFTECGRLPQVGRKWDRFFDVVLMEKALE